MHTHTDALSPPFELLRWSAVSAPSTMFAPAQSADAAHLAALVTKALLNYALFWTSLLLFVTHLLGYLYAKAVGSSLSVLAL